jgi:electron transfer flavoprotein alpha subunit
MAEILVVAEHRAGELCEITLQMLSRAADLCRTHGLELITVVLGDDVRKPLDELSGRAGRIIAYSDPRLRHFSPREQAQILAPLLLERKPLLTLLGHTPWSMDLAPALALKTGYPLATDCVDVLLDLCRGFVPQQPPKVVRQVYGGKMFSREVFKEAPGYLATVRAGSFPAAKPAGYQAEVVYRPLPPLTGEIDREFIAYEDTAKGEVDITQAELLVSIGRGIGDEENIGLARELAALMGGSLACSRPVVDKKWLPKCHQVGTSGKSVKPRVYLALGISGAFQHVAGIGGAETVIAVNKDKRAPIFRAADYGAVADVLDIVAALKARLLGTRG